MLYEVENSPTGGSDGEQALAPMKPLVALDYQSVFRGHTAAVPVDTSGQWHASAAIRFSSAGNLAARTHDQLHREGGKGGDRDALLTCRN
ncbi:hypothetical protein [Actinoplanes awajinensis]|uniref:hypothetical protein n=1 Tax=Actinoplanes awajinensis TaxID=135946 RepID=UPI0012F7F84C|nr:hypothetical protein [Actinoplanes awajinensis]